MTKRQKHLLWFLIAITSLFPLVFWYKAGRLIYIGDLNYPLNPLMYWGSKLTQTWNDTFPGGATHSQAPSLLLYQGIPAVLSWLKVNLSMAQILVYTFWIALPSLTIAFFGEELRNKVKLSQVFTYALVVLYQFNIYRMIMFGDAAHMVIYATLPLVVGLMLKGERTKSPQWAVWAGIAMVLAAPAGPNPPMYVIFLGALAVFFGYMFATSSERWQTFKRYVIFALAAIGVNVFWIAPFLAGQLSTVSGGGLADNNLASWVDSVSATSSWYNLLRLQGAWDWYAGFNNQPYVPYSASYQTHPFLLGWTLAFPAVAALALIVRRRNWGFVALMAIFGVVGFFLAMGTHEPMMLLFRWLVQHVPMFWIFRSPWYKFGLWQTLAMVILASVTIDVVTNWLRDHWRWIRPVLPVIGSVLVIGAGISVYPFITGKKFPATTAYLDVPGHIEANSNAITATQPGELLLLPNVPAFNYTWHWSGLIDPLFYTTKNRLLFTANLIGTDASSPTRGWLYDAFAAKLYAANGTVAAQGILDWIRPQAVLQRDDVDYNYYAGHDSPEFVKERLKKFGLTESRSSGVTAPWHLYPTGYPETRFQLSRDVVYTQNKPQHVLGSLAELKQLQPDTSFVTTLAAHDQVKAAGIPIRSLVAVDLDKPAVVDPETQFEFEAEPGTYQFYAKQASGALEEPQVQFGTTPIIWQSVGNGWWQSEPRSDVGANGHITVTSPRRSEEHVRSFTGLDNWRVEDVNPNAEGTPHFTASVSTTDPNELNLSADAHTLMDKSELLNMLPGRLYQLRFEYRTDADAPSQYSVHLAGVERTALSAGLPASTDWKTITAEFRVDPGTTHSYLNLFSFSPKVGTAAHHSYRNVSVTEVSSLETLLLQEVQATGTAESVEPVTLTHQAPTNVGATIGDRQQAALLTFDQQFDKNWHLASSSAPHFQGNWYANSWILPAGPATTVEVTYGVQQWLIFGGIVSVLMGISLGFLLRQRR